LEVHVCVEDEEVEELVEGEEFCVEDFEGGFAAAEEEHFVGFFLCGG
jgi:hypothetical protein